MRILFVHRVSELEIENEKLHKDILLLRNSIDRGIPEKELEGNQYLTILTIIVTLIQKKIIFSCFTAQFVALEAENKRRRDECIQLRSILAQRSHTSPNKMSQNGNNIDHSDDTMLHESELQQAFEAQKMVNRKLESELTAITDEKDAKIFDLGTEIDELRAERNQLQEILHNQIRTMDGSNETHSLQNGNSLTSITESKHQSIDYLMHEIKSISAAYAQVLVGFCEFFLSIRFYF